jgi:hypothetical protein
MNARKIWTEIFQKPAGRLGLFLAYRRNLPGFRSDAEDTATEG